MAQLNDLIVNGNARFLNTIHGSIDKLGTATVGGTTTPIYLNAGTPTALSYTIAKSVPASAIFTDNYVNRTDSTANSALRVLLTTEADDANTTGTARKSSKLTFNPSTCHFVTKNSSGIQTADIYPITDGGCIDVCSTTSSVSTPKVRLNGATSTVTADNFKKGVPNGTTYDVAYMSATPTSGQIVVTDGTTGGIKSSGYTTASFTLSDVASSITRNTTNVSAVTLNCYKFGRIVVLNLISLQTAKSLGSEEVLLTGLPAAAANQNVMVGNHNDLKSYRLHVTTTGSLVAWYPSTAVPSGAVLCGTIVYISAS